MLNLSNKNVSLQGVDPAIRSEVWKFVLGYFPWAMTHAERKEHRDRQVEEYYRMKLQWHSLSADQESRFAAFKQRKDLIDKDVNRTDRTIPFYAGENNANVATLRDVLMTYLMYDFDLGYVQVRRRLSHARGVQVRNVITVKSLNSR